MRADGISQDFPTGGGGGKKVSAWRIPVLSSNAPVPLFQAGVHRAKPQAQAPHQSRLVQGMTPGRQALQVAVQKFGPAPDAISFRTELADELEPWRELLSRRDTLQVRARALEPTTTAVEVVVVERDGSSWGTNVPLTTEWKEIRVPLISLRHFSHWAGSPPGRGRPGDHVRPGEITGISVCFGAWLYPDHAGEPHTLELESITVE